ncbi:dihydroorotase [Secundilactobacillus kimchicus JCM 15530]|uniref:Dihydroorotase n=2 Tax=Secundilactobacillus kimchicus TaxID=528209 RepID=A0A0R1HYM8_9LACO|nr:dihydroorotase [Secundilactobacillus kimchicus JCM 15530]
MMERLVLSHGQRLIGDQLVACDVVITAGKISQISDAGSADTGDSDVIDLQGAFVSPGLVDVHEHFRDPGETEKETIKTGTQAAAHGGFTTVAAMPNVLPVPDTPERFAAQLQRNADQAVVHVQQYAPITQGRTGDQLVAFDQMAALGAMAFTNDGNGVQTADTMYLAMQQAAVLGVPIVAHAEADSLVHGGVMHEGEISRKLGLPGIPSVSETAQVARDVTLAAATGAHYHVCHVSAAGTVAVLRAAKQNGVAVTAEVSPHHLLLNDHDIIRDDAQFKMNPPLGAPTDQQALLAGLLDGTIDMIATDHAPHTAAQKAQSMRQAPFGIVGNETAFSLLYTKLVRPGVVSLAQLIDWLASRPAEVFGLSGAGRLTVGQPADIAVFDLATTETVTPEYFQSKGHNSPFMGETVAGQTVLTMVGGTVVYQR